METTQTVGSMYSPGRAPTMTNGTVFKLEKAPTAGAKIWTLIFDLPGEKVNKLSRVVMEQFEANLPKLEEMGRNQEIDALVLFSGKPGNFIAGADIEMIQSAKTQQEAESLSRMGQKLLDRWEDLPFP